MRRRTGMPRVLSPRAPGQLHIALFYLHNTVLAVVNVGKGSTHGESCCPFLPLLMLLLKCVVEGRVVAVRYQSSILERLCGRCAEGV